MIDNKIIIQTIKNVKSELNKLSDNEKQDIRQKSFCTAKSLVSRRAKQGLNLFVLVQKFMQL